MAQVTVRPSGSSPAGDYTNLKSAIDAAENDILIDVSDTAWSTEDDQSSTILVDSNAVVIEATGDAKTGPAVGSSTYRLRHTGTNHLFQIDYDMTITGVDMCNESTGSSDEVIRIDANSVDLKCDSCLLWFTSRVDQQDLIYINSRGTITVELENCIGWNAYRSVIDQYLGGPATHKINSSHFYNCGYSASGGLRSGIFGTFSPTGTIDCYAFNSLFEINTGKVADKNATGTANITIDRCLTNVADYTSSNWASETITDSPISRNWTDDDSKSSDGDWVIVKDLTTAPYDLSLATNIYNEAQDAHADSSGATLTIPSVDILGTSRPQNTNYDIGAFEILVSGDFQPAWAAYSNIIIQHGVS